MSFEKTPKELTQEARESLISAGIGDRFISEAISHFGETGKRYLAAFSEPTQTKRLLRAGLLCLFRGKYAREFAHTFAGSLLLVFDASVNSIHLSELSDLLDRRDRDENERLGSLRDCEVLVVTEFVTTLSNPLDPRSAFRVEQFLLERSETAGRTLILVGDGQATDIAKWWNPLLTQRIAQSFIQETVATYANSTATQVI